MSNKESNTKPSDSMEEVENALNSTENFFETNSKPISYIFGAAIVVALLFVGYQYYIKAPKENKAKKEMWVAQQYFAKDSFQLAINGDAGQNIGFLDIIDEYSGTSSANLAYYYTGISYLHLGDYQNAIDFLSQFSSDDVLLNTMSTGAQGDAYCELGEKEKAISLYQDAANMSDNDMTAPLYLFKAGICAESIGNKEKAKGFFQEVKEKYPKSQQASNADKYIARLQ